MDLSRLLGKKKSAILAEWVGLLVDSYPAETSRFLRKEKNRFANPVGHSISHGMGALYDQLTGGMDPEKVSASLDEVIRVRAVQDFSPSQAVAWIFSLKKIVRKQLEAEIAQGQVLPEELQEFESRVDLAALMAFDIFVKCREKIYELKANHARNITFKLLERANLISEITEQEPDDKGGK